MNLTFIGKTLPIQGGVSRTNFWTAYALAERGHQVELITNADEVEYHFRIFQDHPQFLTVKDIVSKLEGKFTIESSQNARELQFIPKANPFVSKLVARSIESVERLKSDLIYSYYLEPYGVAAALTSKLTEVPFGIRHAGSDVGRLILSKEVRTTYEKILQSASFLFPGPSTKLRLLNLGISPENIYDFPFDTLPDQFFNPDVEPLDINALLESVLENLPEDFYNGIYHRLANKTFDPSKVTIGIYGKIGDSKGTYDLIRALGILKSRGLDFNFIAVAQGRVKQVYDFSQEIKKEGIENNCWMLPFIPHWHIPNFIKACSAVCFLERDFQIAIHAPSIPREVLRTGSLLVVSKQIARRQNLDHWLVDMEDYITVDPKNEDELATKLALIINREIDPQQMGKQAYKKTNSGFMTFQEWSVEVSNVFEAIASDCADRRFSVSFAEMQSYLGRLYVDEPFRQLHHIQPDVNMENYSLSVSEKATIQKIDRDTLELFSRSLEMKRVKKFAAAFPHSSEVNRKSFFFYAKRFCNMHLARPKDPWLSQMTDFAVFLEQCLSTDESVPSFSKDLIKYERIYLEAKYSSIKGLTFDNINQEVDIPPIDKTSMLSLRESTWNEEFDQDVYDIAKNISNKEALSPNQALNLKTYYIVQTSSNTRLPKVLKINKANFDLINIAIQHGKLDPIIARFQQLYPGVSDEMIWSNLTKLVDANILVSTDGKA